MPMAVKGNDTLSCVISDLIGGVATLELSYFAFVLRAVRTGSGIGFSLY